MEKDPTLNTVDFKIFNIVGSQEDGSDWMEETTFHGHFGYDLCIHLRTREKYGDKPSRPTAHYHHFCAGANIAELGQLFDQAQEFLTHGGIPEFKPVI